MENTFSIHITPRSPDQASLAKGSEQKSTLEPQPPLSIWVRCNGLLGGCLFIRIGGPAFERGRTVKGRPGLSY